VCVLVCVCVCVCACACACACVCACWGGEEGLCYCIVDLNISKFGH
jgi:hypothetical protein